MDDPKSRGRKHLKNKQKYKPNKLNVSKSATGTKKSKEQLAVKPSKPKATDSNWDRYESDEEENNANVLTDSTNFALLANATITQGSYFQFKTHKNVPFNIDYESNSQSAINLFKIDLNVLSESVGSIPFVKRSDLSETYFTVAQKKYMDRTAVDNKNAYLNKYKNDMCDRNTTVKGNKNEEFVGNLNETESGIGTHSSEMNDLFNNTRDIEVACDEVIIKEVHNIPRSKKVQELEQWLDEFLDS